MVLDWLKKGIWCVPSREIDQRLFCHDNQMEPPWPEEVVWEGMSRELTSPLPRSLRLATELLDLMNLTQLFFFLNVFYCKDLFSFPNQVNNQPAITKMGWLGARAPKFREWKKPRWAGARDWVKTGNECGAFCAACPWRKNCKLWLWAQSS